MICPVCEYPHAQVNRSELMMTDKDKQVVLYRKWVNCPSCGQTHVVLFRGEVDRSFKLYELRKSEQLEMECMSNESNN